jgi:general secretion pathway protein M
MNRPSANRSVRETGLLRARWAQLAPREKNLLLAAAILVLTALAWQIVLAPAWQLFRTGTAQSQALDAQLQQMQSLQAQARALQQQAPLAYDDALRALTQATKQSLGTAAQMSVNAERANITLQAVGADALAQWLAQVRLNARSVPLEARISRIVTPAGVAWSGVLVMSLPQR